jgi:hypothetical protein
MADQAEALKNLKSILSANGTDEGQNHEYNDLNFPRHDDPDIVLPRGMSFEQAIQSLERRKEEMEQTVERRREFPGVYPADGLVALKRAVSKVFGYVSQERVVQTLFGEQDAAPRQKDVSVGYGETERVFIDRLAPPALEGGYIEPLWKSESDWPVFTLHFNVKAKHKDAVEKLVDQVETELLTNSIYNGKAIRVTLDYATDQSVDFDLSRHEPQFMDTESEVDPLILNDETSFSLETQVLQRIRHPELVKEMGVGLNHGVLLSGPYGTGKTLTAAHIARECEANGWTFVYVDDVRELSAAFEFARRYSPAVVFGEDIDAAVASDDSTKDEISNAIDDMESKGEPILTVLTTNHVDEIDSKFLRAGRIDSFIHVGRPNADTVRDFVKLYTQRSDGTSMLEDGADLEAVGQVMDGYVPSFIAEACERAKMRAQFRAKEEGHDRAVVRMDDLIQAGKGLEEHAELASLGDEDDSDPVAVRFLDELSEQTADLVKDEHPSLVQDTADEVSDRLR